MFTLVVIKSVSEIYTKKKRADSSNFSFFLIRSFLCDTLVWTAGMASDTIKMAI